MLTTIYVHPLGDLISRGSRGHVHNDSQIFSHSLDLCVRPDTSISMFHRCLSFHRHRTHCLSQTPFSPLLHLFSVKNITTHPISEIINLKFATDVSLPPTHATPKVLARLHLYSAGHPQCLAPLAKSRQGINSEEGMNECTNANKC